MPPSSARDRALRVLWLLLAAEAVAGVALGVLAFRAPQGWQPEQPDKLGYGAGACAGPAVVRAADVRAANAVVEAWLAARVAEQPLDPGAAQILGGIAWEALLRLDLDRAWFLTGSSTAEAHADALRARRGILLDAAAPILGAERAFSFEADFYRTWREAWRGVEIGRPLPSELRARVAEVDLASTAPERR